MSEIVNQFYGAIRSGDVVILDALIDQSVEDDDITRPNRAIELINDLTHRRSLLKSQRILAAQ